ncbi:MAG: sodium-dependent transporter [Succinivibrionaceae bacterium]
MSQNENKRSGFSSKLGGMLAAAGSAIGLGNIWRFSTEAGNNGGSAFILIYLIIILFFGMPLLLSEFVIGRRARANVGNAFGVLAPNTHWNVIGICSVAVAAIILTYYNVVVGWVLYYLCNAIDGTFMKLGEVAIKEPSIYNNFFSNFLSGGSGPLSYACIVVIMMFLVIVLGVERGIERLSKLLMPSLFFIMVGMMIVSLSTMTGTKQGLEFLFKLDFEAINSKICLSALGQCFYSCSIGMGIITYASYIRKDVNLPNMTFQVGFLDTLAAIMAGMIIFPAVFSVPGLQPSAGASLVFVSLPNVFNQSLNAYPILNYIIPLSFYLILFVAAITSSIFLYEVATAYVHEHLKISRKLAATIIGLFTIVIGSLSALSFGPLKDFTLFGMIFFDFLDYVTAKIVLPLTGLGGAIFVGWYLKRDDVIDELTSGHMYRFIWFKLYYFLIRFIIPLLIVMIMIFNFV